MGYFPATVHVYDSNGKYHGWIIRQIIYGRRKAGKELPPGVNVYGKEYKVRNTQRKAHVGPVYPKATTLPKTVIAKLKKTGGKNGLYVGEYVSSRRGRG